MSNTIDGLSLGLDFIQWAVSLAFMAFWFKMMGRFMREAMASVNPTFNRNPPSAKVSMRRIWCKHTHVSRLRNSYGLNYTGCTSCGVDVNRGKRPEEWR